MRMKKNRIGVSEVVGSVLILIITVTMFTVVMLWVISYPTPSGRAYVDLNAEVNDLDITHKYVNITHLGGESLEDDDTAIYVYINGSLAGGKSYKISDADNYATIGDSLSVGETWSKTFSISSTSTVYVMIIDTEGNEVIYDETIQGVSGNNKPVVAFACTVPSSVPADGSTAFKVYTYILDPDKDVSTVTVNLSSVGKSTYSMSSDDGIIFKTSSLIMPSGTATGTYKSNIVNATDSNGNTATGYVQVTVTTPANLTDIYDYFDWSMEDDEGATGYDIYNETGLTTRVGTRVFLQGETIYMQIGSLTLRKIKIQNSFVLYDSSFEKLEPQTSEYEPLEPDYVEGGPLDEPAFYDIATPNPKYYMYEYNCTAPSTAGQYLVYAGMKDTAGHNFVTWDTIYVCKADGSVPNYPKIVTCSDPNNDGNLTDLYLEDTFSYTEKMYVKIVTMDVTSIANTAMGDVEINNFKGTWHVKKCLPTPPTTAASPLSALFFDSNISSLSWDGRTDGDSFYTFSINLVEQNQYNWLKGTNTYVLMIRYFEDNNEQYNIMAVLVKVKGRVSTIDIIASVGGQGSWWDEGESQVCWYSSDEYWDRTTVSGAPTTGWGWWNVKVAKALAVGDIDGDGDNDVVVGMADDRDANIAWFENLESDGSDWLAHPVNTVYQAEQYKVESIAIADLDFDGDMEIMAGMTDSWGTTSTGVHIFVNDGDWTDITMMPMTGGAAKPISKGSQDNTSSNLSYVLLDDDEYYNVTGNKTLFFDSWNVTGMGGSITDVILRLQYKTDSGYVGNESIRWALDGQPLANTSIILNDTTKIDPDNPDKEYRETFNLYDEGVNTFSEIENLDISFHHNGYTLHKDNASSENSIIGYVLNRYTDTWASDNIYESIKEVTAGGGIEYTNGTEDGQVTDFPGIWGDVAQSFNTTDAIKVSNIGLYLLRKDDQNPTNIYLEIRSDSPTGTVLGTSNTISTSVLTSSYTWQSFGFSPHVSLDASTQYYLRLRSDPNSTVGPVGRLIRWGYNHTIGCLYPDGKAYYHIDYPNPGDVGELVDYDFSFKLYEVNRAYHEWTIPLTSGGYSWTFNIEAYCDHTSEQDNFTFYYSTDGTNWTEMLTVNATSDPNTYQTYIFSNGSLLGASNVYIRVNDTNQNAEDNASDEQDTLYVDRMYVETRTSANVSIDYMWIDVIATTGTTKSIMHEIETADIDINGRPDVVGVDKNGETVIYFNNVADPLSRNISAEKWIERTIGDVGSGPSGARHLLEIGYFEGTGDDDLDVVRTNGYNLYMYKNPGIAGDKVYNEAIWEASETEYDPTGDREITALAIGDMNGDALVDITVGTKVKTTQDRPQLWQIRQNVSGTLDDPIRIRTATMNDAIDFAWWWAKKPQISDIEVGDIDGDGDNDTVIGVQISGWWSWWGTTIQNNLWCYYNNCTETTWADPDGGGSSGPTDVLWYMETMLYVDPWDTTSDETVYNIELGYIDT